MPNFSQAHLSKLLESGLSSTQSTQILSILHSFKLPQSPNNLLNSSTSLKRWTETDLPALSHQQTQLQLYSQAFANANVTPSSNNNNIHNALQLEKLEASLKDDHEAIRSTIQLDISLEQRRNSQAAQEIQNLTLQTVELAGKQRIEAKKQLEWVDKSATIAICSFAALLTGSFLAYCVKFKSYNDF